MALIACPECTREISDRATACPHCGNPMGVTSPPRTAVTTAPGEVVTTEATGKFYKGFQATGAGLILLGMGSCGAGAAPGVIGLLFLAGLALVLYGRIGAWWHHE